MLLLWASSSETNFGGTDAERHGLEATVLQGPLSNPIGPVANLGCAASTLSTNLARLEPTTGGVTHSYSRLSDFTLVRVPLQAFGRSRSHRVRSSFSRRNCGRSRGAGRSGRQRSRSKSACLNSASATAFAPKQKQKFSDSLLSLSPLSKISPSCCSDLYIERGELRLD